MNTKTAAYVGEVNEEVCELDVDVVADVECVQDLLPLLGSTFDNKLLLVSMLLTLLIPFYSDFSTIFENGKVKEDCKRENRILRPKIRLKDPKTNI